MSDDLNFEVTSRFHADVFEEFGLKPETWTLHQPGMIFGQQNSEILWRETLKGTGGFISEIIVNSKIIVNSEIIVNMVTCKLRCADDDLKMMASEWLENLFPINNVYGDNPYLVWSLVSGLNGLSLPRRYLIGILLVEQDQGIVTNPSSSPSEPANEVYGIGGLPGAGAALNTTPQSTTTSIGTSTSTNTSPETINAQPGGQSSGQLGDSTTTTTAQQPTDGTEPPATSTNTSTTETPTTPASTASTDFLVNVSGSQPVAGAPNYSNGVVGSTPASSSGITFTSDLLNEPSLTQQMLAQPVTTSPVRVLPPNAHEGQDQVTPPGGSEGSAMPVSGQDGGDSTSGASIPCRRAAEMMRWNPSRWRAKQRLSWGIKSGRRQGPAPR